MVLPPRTYSDVCQDLLSLTSLEPQRLGRGEGVSGQLRTRELLETLGNPHHGLKFVHIAGTSGKGSTLTFLQHLLAHGGVHVLGFTSPHVTTLLERITVGAGELPVQAFLRAAEQIRPVLSHLYCHSTYGAPTFFEALFALALLMAQDLKVDLMLVEAGIGGQLDTTQVIPPPLVAIITDVGLDHQQLLGDNLALIAADKAGIFKPGSYLLTGVTRPEALAPLEARASQVGTPLRRVISPPDGDLGEAAPPPAAQALALAAYHCLVGCGLHLPPPPVPEALATFYLPGRFERLGEPPHLVVDVAHNPDKLHFFSERFHRCFGPGGTVIFTLARDKDLKGCLEELRTFDSLVVTRLVQHDRKVWTPREIAAAAQGQFRRVEVTLSPYDALVWAEQNHKKDQPIAATGSTFLVSELRALFGCDVDWLTRGKISPSGSV